MNSFTNCPSELFNTKGFIGSADISRNYICRTRARSPTVRGSGVSFVPDEVHAHNKFGQRKRVLVSDL